MAENGGRIEATGNFFKPEAIKIPTKARPLTLADIEQTVISCTSTARSDRIALPVPRKDGIPQSTDGIAGDSEAYVARVVVINPRTKDKKTYLFADLRQHPELQGKTQEQLMQEGWINSDGTVKVEGDLRGVMPQILQMEQAVSDKLKSTVTPGPARIGPEQNAKPPVIDMPGHLLKMFRDARSPEEFKKALGELPDDRFLGVPAKAKLETLVAQTQMIRDSYQAILKNFDFVFPEAAHNPTLRKQIEERMKIAMGRAVALDSQYRQDNVRNVLAGYITEARPQREAVRVGR